MLLFLSPLFAVAQTKWTAYEYNISFKIKNAGINVSGKFTGLKTELKFSPDKLEASRLKGSVDVPTIKTGIDKRDKDLLGEKYFNADQYKLIEVSSTKISRAGNQFTGTFNVTIKGVTKQVEIPFEFNQSGNNAEFRGTFTIHRSDFGIGGKTLTMSDEADVSILVKAKS